MGEKEAEGVDYDARQTPLTVVRISPSKWTYRRRAKCHIGAFFFCLDLVSKISVVSIGERTCFITATALHAKAGVELLKGRMIRTKRGR